MSTVLVKIWVKITSLQINLGPLALWPAVWSHFMLSSSTVYPFFKFQSRLSTIKLHLTFNRHEGEMILVSFSLCVNIKKLLSHPHLHNVWPFAWLSETSRKQKRGSERLSLSLFLKPFTWAIYLSLPREMVLKKKYVHRFLRILMTSHTVSTRSF